jgi:hypothetical protein
MPDVICPFLAFLEVHQAMAEFSDVVLDLAGSDPALFTTRRGTRAWSPGSAP